MKESLKKEYLAKIDQAVKFSSYAAAIYAIATTETAQSIATAAFNKCGDLWNEAAKVALDLYPSISEFEQRDALRIDWMNRGISVVVDQRAKQKLTPPLPEYQKKPETKQDGTGI